MRESPTKFERNRDTSTAWPYDARSHQAKDNQHGIENKPPVAADALGDSFATGAGCSAQRIMLALIRNAGIERTIIEYLKTPPDRATLESMIRRMGIRLRDVLRERGTADAVGRRGWCCVGSLPWIS